MDLVYPDDKKDFFKEFPPLCTRRLVEKSEYGPHTLSTMQKLKYRPPKQEKLISDLQNKVHYQIHYRNLKQVLGLGLILTKVHEIVR